jgi:transposase
MSRRAATRRYEISESVAIKWLERVERDCSRRSVRRMRPEKPSGRVSKPRLARPLPPGLSPRVLGGTSRWTISGNLEP